MIVSVTERGQYKRCHKQWDYQSKSRQNLSPVIPPTALSLGGLVHKALQLWCENPDGNASDFFGIAAIKEITAMKLRYKAQVGVEMNDSELVQFEEMFALGHEMMVNYQAYHGSPLPEGFELVQAEQTIMMPVPDTMHVCPSCLGDGKQISTALLLGDCPNCEGKGKLPHYLEGTLDAIIRESSSGLLFVLERKTYGNRPKLDYLQTQDQFIAYCWLLGRLGIGDLGGVAYDGMWKKPIATLRGKDRTLPDLFTRTLITHSRTEIQNFERELIMEVKEMASPNLYRNFRWEGCWDCQVKELCVAEYQGEDTSWLRSQNFQPRPTEILWEDEDEE